MMGEGNQGKKEKAKRKPETKGVLDKPPSFILWASCASCSLAAVASRTALGRSPQAAEVLPVQARNRGTVAHIPHQGSCR